MKAVPSARAAVARPDESAPTAGGARTVIRGTMTLAAGNVGAQVLSFVRNIIVARLLGPEHLGVAATFIVTLTLVEVFSDLSADKMLIQADDGDDESFQGVVHLMSFLRGLGLGLVLLCLAWPATSLFDVPQARWAFAALAIYPVLRGLTHLDTLRWQRTLRFGPHVMVEFGVHLALTLLAWPLCAWLGNYAAVLWILLAQAAMTTIGSHLLASRRYRWRWDAAAVRRIARFGWPLAINGALLFVIVQGDQVLVGSLYSMHELGLYAAAFTLTAAPTLLLSRMGNAVLLPLLSSRRDEPAAFEAACAGGVRLYAMASAALAGGFLLAGPVLVSGLFGEAFAPAGAVMGWLGVMQAVRLVRMVPTQAAIALGDTRNSMLANCWRMTALGLALPAAALGADVAWIAIAGVAGEGVALGSSIARLRRRQGLPAWTWMRPILPMAAIVGVTVAGQAAGVPAWVLAAALLATGIRAVAGLVWQSDGGAGAATGAVDASLRASG